MNFDFKLPDFWGLPKGLPAGGLPSSPLKTGLLVPGNIDIHHRPVVRNPDGSISTVRSITIGQDGRAVLIPTVVGGRVVSNEAAIQHFQKTGQHLGIFSDEASADSYAQRLHRQQAREYVK